MSTSFRSLQKFAGQGLSRIQMNLGLTERLASIVAGGALICAGIFRHGPMRAMLLGTGAGFLLRGADHNLAVRLGFISGRFKGDVKDAGHALHANYRAMAIANGVAPDDQTLAPCRD